MRINIIGKAPGWEKAMDAHGERWGVNNLFMRSGATLSRTFDMHCPPTLREQAEEAGIPFFCHENYPLRAISEAFGTQYFGSSIDYMIALALYEGATEICLYGVDMSHPSEYGWQKSSCEYWIGFARGRGCTVTVHGENTRLLRTKTGKMYGM